MQEPSSLLTLSLRVDQYIVFIIKTNSTKNNYIGRARKDGSRGAGPQTAGVLHFQVSLPGSAASRGRTKQGRGSFCSLRTPNGRGRSRSRGRLRAPGLQSVACTGSRAGGTPPESTLTSLGMWESAVHSPAQWTCKASRPQGSLHRVQREHTDLPTALQTEAARPAHG